jgi:tetratricopeptide (TPR) repeat protein
LFLALVVCEVGLGDPGEKISEKPFPQFLVVTGSVTAGVDGSDKTMSLEAGEFVVGLKAHQATGKNAPVWISVRRITSTRATEVWVPEENLVSIQVNNLQDAEELIQQRQKLRNSLKQVNQHLDHSIRAFDFRFDPVIPRLIEIQRNPLLVEAWKDILFAHELNRQQAEGGKPLMSDPYFAEAVLWMSVQSHDDCVRNFVMATHLEQSSQGNLSRQLAYYKILSNYLDEYYRVPDGVVAQGPQLQRAQGRRHFGLGVQSYRGGDFNGAVHHFSNAIQLVPRDPLSWYYRALAFKRLGNLRRAQHDVIIGVKLERQTSDHDGISRGLIGIQGPLRIWLERYRHGDPSLQLVSE